MKTKEIVKNFLYKTSSNRFLNKIYNNFKGNAAVLCYHRVVDKKTFSKEISPQKNLMITRENFEMQMKFLGENFDVIPINELEGHLRSKSDEFKVIITFDDGYIDNKLNAIPILEKYNIPATIYFVTRFLENDSFMWWYELWEISNNRKKIEFIFKNIKYSYNCRNKKEILNTYFSLNDIFTKLNYSDQLLLISKIRDKKLQINYNSLIMNKNDIINISKNKIITVGSHTHNHVSLKNLDEKTVFFEITKSKQFLENLTNYRIDHFCYPYGTKNDFSNRDINLLKKAGYKTATQTETLALNKKTNIFAIPRISMRNYNSKILSAKLSGLDNLLYSIYRF